MQIAANPGGGLVSPGGPSMSSSSVTLRVRLFETPAAEIFDGGLEPLLTAIVNEPRFRLRSNLINERFLKKERKREGKEKESRRNGSRFRISRWTKGKIDTRSRKLDTFRCSSLKFHAMGNLLEVEEERFPRSSVCVLFFFLICIKKLGTR